MTQADTGLATFSRFLWRDRFETSRHHLTRALSTRFTTCYVEPAPNLGRAARALTHEHERLALEFRRPVTEGRVRVARPLLPQVPLEALLTMPRLYDAERVRQGRALGRLGRRSLHGVSRIVCLESHYPARAIGIVEGLCPDLVVYHCTDEIGELTQLRTRASSAALEAAEREIAARADIVVASSEVLVEKLEPLNPRTYLLPNGVDVETFASALEPGEPPSDLPPAPRLMLVGNLDHGRQEVVDAGALEALAAAEPGWSVVVIGAVSATSAARRRLAPYRNVWFLGPRPRGALASYLRFADVCLIPYTVTPLTRGISPLKLNEYLAAGRPVVATPFAPSLREFDDCITIASGKDLASAVRAVLADPHSDSPAARESRLARARSNSWSARADKLIEHIEEVT